MRFALKTAPQHTTWQAMLDVFKAADDINVFESGWTFDHFYPIFSDSTGPCLEGWVATTALAQATRRLRVGLMVTGNIYRHPAVLANMAATLDIVSNGRLELGIGAGWNQEECDAYGIELPPLRERFDRLDEALAVIVGLLTNETTDFDGKHYQLRAARCEPKPVQRPHPPIVIGGGGEKRTLRTAAKFAQHWNVPGATPEVFAHKRDVLHAHCADVGRDPSEITTSTQLRHAAGEDPKAVAEQASELAAVGCDLVVVYLTPHDPGLLEPLAHALEPLR
ncbi:MAG TPA: LLM class F420-dependent oxidoreductase [Acidimicrobiales bacterium]|nr:LLM class F420-dependent oxidoreductase [Acidimicrobiales bacterium]